MADAPSSQVAAAFITPECRMNRGDEGAWDEAVARLRAEYDAILKGWSARSYQPTLNLVLTMERPDPYAPPDLKRWNAMRPISDQDDEGGSE